MSNVTPIKRLRQLAKLMREVGLTKLNLEVEGITLEIPISSHDAVKTMVIEEAIAPGVKEDPLAEDDVLFHSAGGHTPDMPMVPAGLLNSDGDAD